MSINNKSPDNIDYQRICSMYSTLCEYRRSKTIMQVYAESMTAEELNFIHKVFNVEFIFSNGRLSDVVFR